jgi:membrane-bound ClpP family serine protease
VFFGRDVVRWDHPIPDRRSTLVIVLGVILVLIGWLASIPILTTLGVILIVVGLILALLGATGRAVGGRKVWY